MKSRISRTHRSSSTTISSTPRVARYASGPRKVRFSPITMRGIPYRSAVPLHMSQGESVV